LIWEQRSSITAGHTPADVAWWEHVWDGAGSKAASGESVSEDSTRRVAVAWRCIDLLSSLGTYPCKYYSRQSDGGKEELPDDALYSVLHDMFNPDMTAVEGWEMMFGHAALRHNAYAQIVRDTRDDVRELWPLNPSRMVVERAGGRLAYRYTETGGNERVFPAKEIFHLRGPMSDGLVGTSPLSYGVDVVGLRQSQVKQASGMFKDGLRIPFVWVFPGKFKDNQKRKETEAALNDAYGGADNAGKAPLLEQGLDLKSVGMTAEDAEALNQAKLSLNEICRYYGVPPHKAYILTDATYSNIEEQNTDWVVDTARAWYERAEAVIRKSLVPAAERRTRFAEFNMDAMLRGNTEDRWNANQIAIQTGVASINDIRKRENMNPVEGGDVHLVPLNYIPLDQIGDVPVSTEPTPEDNNDERQEERTIATRMRVRKSYEPLFIDAFQRIVHREVRDHRNAIKKFLGERTVAEFEVYLTGYYEKLPQAIRQTMTPVVSAYARAMFDAVGAEVGVAAWTPEMDLAVTRYVSTLEAHYSAGGLAQMNAIIRDNADNIDGALNTRLDEWDTRKAKKMTRVELVRSGEEIAAATYRVGGITLKRWHTIGTSCPMCNWWNGKVVGIEENFAAKGDTAYFKPGEPAYAAKRNIFAPPLHDSCDCIVRAETKG